MLFTVFLSVSISPSTSISIFRVRSPCEPGVSVDPAAIQETYFCHSRSNQRDRADLVRQIRAHAIHLHRASAHIHSINLATHIIRQLLPNTLDIRNISLTAKNTTTTDIERDSCDFTSKHTQTDDLERMQIQTPQDQAKKKGQPLQMTIAGARTIVLTVFFNSNISPLASTPICLDRSPFATAFVTSAIPRTWIGIGVSIGAVPAHTATATLVPAEQTRHAMHAAGQTSPVHVIHYPSMPVHPIQACSLPPKAL
jgi:hypothetical protein